MTRRWLTAALLFTLAASTNPRAATRPTVESTWRTVDILIDGSDREWTDTLAPIPAVPASFSITNDGTRVFVRVKTTDAATIQQVVRGGLLVWFDAKGGDAKTFGIKYPVGTPPPNPDADARGAGSRSGRPGGGNMPGGGRPGPPPLHGARDRAGRGGQVEDLLALVPNRLEIYGPRDDDIRSLVLAYATGVSVAMTVVNNALFYELSVPLARDAEHPYAIGVSAGATVGLGLQSSKIATSGGGFLPGLAGMTGGGMSGGRPGGGSGRPGGGSGGGPPSDDRAGDDKDAKPPARPKPFTVWQTLILAKP